MNNLRTFIRSYWNYFLELEQQFIETKRFVAFDKANAKSYSIEYLKLYQAVCSEIDVVGKEIANIINPNFKIDSHTNIKKWGFEVQQHFKDIQNVTVTFDDEYDVQPYKNWEYEYHTTIDKNGKSKTGLRIKDGKKPLKWWQNYNSIKHRRIGLVEETKNFQLANQSNLIQAFSALFVLETLFITDFHKAEQESVEKSILFKMR